VAFVLAFDAAFVAGAGLAAWVGVGVLLGVALLVRYAAVALVVAAGVVLLRERRWRALAVLGASSLAVLVPWLAYRALIGGNDYARAFSNFSPQGLGGWLKAGSLICADFFGNAAPAALFGGWFSSFFPTPITPATLAMGLCVTSLILIGAVMGFVRPRPGRSGVGDAYLLATACLVVLWTVPFAWYGDNLMQRLLIPVGPFAVVAALRALDALASRFGTLVRDLAQAALMLLGVLSNVHGCLLAMFFFWVPPAYTRAYAELFDVINHKTPPDSMLMAQDGRLMTMYTGRFCETIPVFPGGPGELPREPSPRQLVLIMHQRHVRYLVGTPQFEWGEAHDRTIVLYNTLITQAPGLLRDVYKSRRGNFAVFAVDPAVLDDLAARIKGTK
jgi:hypothetical protein